MSFASAADAVMIRIAMLFRIERHRGARLSSATFIITAATPSHQARGHARNSYHRAQPRCMPRRNAAHAFLFDIIFKESIDTLTQGERVEACLYMMMIVLRSARFDGRQVSTLPTRRLRFCAYMMIDTYFPGAH